jgi:hypothetical protein
MLESGYTDAAQISACTAWSDAEIALAVYNVLETAETDARFGQRTAKVPSFLLRRT